MKSDTSETFRAEFITGPLDGQRSDEMVKILTPSGSLRVPRTLVLTHEGLFDVEVMGVSHRALGNIEGRYSEAGLTDEGRRAYYWLPGD